MDEYRSAKESVKRGKSPGVDGINAECILGIRTDDGSNILVSPLDEMMLDIFNEVLVSGRFPGAWRQAVVVPVLKGGDAKQPTNYRGIALLSCLSKLFTSIIEVRVTQFEETCGLISDEQFGFTRERCTLDGLFVLDTLIDSTLNAGGQLFVVFVDFEKAYDFVNRDALFYKMLLNKMSGCVLRIIQSMYQLVLSSVRSGGCISDTIHQLVGLRQGCILSPCLFSLFIADLPKYLGSLVGDAECKGVELHDSIVRVLMNADDLALVARSAADLQNALDALREYCRKWHLHVNIKKTKIVIFDRQETGKKGEKLACSRRAMLRQHIFYYNNSKIDV